MIGIYARQSVERENSISIETQIDFCKSMIRPNEREDDIIFYIDEGQSGGNTDRKGFLNMMHDIEHGTINKVIVYKLDRMSRSLNDFVGILQTFKNYGVEFVSSQETFDTSTVYGDLIIKILIIFAEFERTSIINRVRDAYAKRTDLGLYMGGRHQYGFDLQETLLNGIKTKIYVPIPEALEQLRYIFAAYAQESVSLRQLQATLLEKKILPLVGKAWTTAKLSALLKNPIYVKADSDIYDYFESRGVRMVDALTAYDGSRAAQLYGRTTHDTTLADWSDMKLVLMQHCGIIPSEIWLNCQHKISQNKQIGNAASNKTSWLAGKLICAKCGHTMTTIKSKSPKNHDDYRRYFNCTGKSHKKICSGIPSTIYAEDMENMVSHCISEKLRHIPCYKPTPSSSNFAPLNAYKLQLKALEQQEKRLGDILLEDTLQSAMIQIANKKAAELHQQKQNLQDKINALQEQDVDRSMPFDLTEKWQTAPFAQKKAVVSVLIKHIIVFEDGIIEIIWNF